MAALDHVAVIEASWKGRVEAVSFPLPNEMKYLSKATKRHFLAHCELSTAEKRVKQLLNRSPVFITEMTETYQIGERSPTYEFLYHNITTLKWYLESLNAPPLTVGNFFWRSNTNMTFVPPAHSGACMLWWCC
jgi:hypothetical protein